MTGQSELTNLTACDVTRAWQPAASNSHAWLPGMPGGGGLLLFFFFYTFLQLFGRTFCTCLYYNITYEKKHGGRKTFGRIFSID